MGDRQRDGNHQPSSNSNEYRPPDEGSTRGFRSQAREYAIF
jgi:hypothetical protein